MLTLGGTKTVGHLYGHMDGPPSPSYPIDSLQRWLFLLYSVLLLEKLMMAFISEGIFGRI